MRSFKIYSGSSKNGRLVELLLDNLSSLLS